MEDSNLPRIEIAMGGGKIVDLMQLKPSDINIEEVFKTLARKGRYNDNADHKVSVAAHLLLVHDLAEYDNSLNFGEKQKLTLRLFALLHDTAEAFIGDIVTGVKRSSFMRDVSDLEDSILMTILESQGFDLEVREFREWMSRIKKYDRQALSLEVPYAFDFIDPRWYSDGWIDVPSVEMINLFGIGDGYAEYSEAMQVRQLMNALEGLKFSLKKTDIESVCGFAA